MELTLKLPAGHFTQDVRSGLIIFPGVHEGQNVATIDAFRKVPSAQSVQTLLLL